MRVTRRECERKLIDLMESAYGIFREYDPNGQHLTMFATRDGICAMGCKYDGGRTVWTVDGYKSPEGYYRLNP